MNNRLTVTLCGSFRKSPTQLKILFNDLKKDFEVMSPANLEFASEKEGFVRTKEEIGKTILEIENKHLEAIMCSDFVVLHALDGYVGTSASLEVGFAYALGVPVLADETPEDKTIAAMLSGSLDDLKVSDKNLPNPGKGIAALQYYYGRIAKRRGWDEESARDTMLLLTEEVGELARAIRKHEGLKRATGYDEIQIGEELADVQLYLVHLANVLNIKLGDAVTDKEQKNARKHKKNTK